MGILFLKNQPLGLLCNMVKEEVILRDLQIFFLVKNNMV